MSISPPRAVVAPNARSRIRECSGAPQNDPPETVRRQSTESRERSKEARPLQEPRGTLRERKKRRTQPFETRGSAAVGIRTRESRRSRNRSRRRKFAKSGSSPSGSAGVDTVPGSVLTSTGNDPSSRRPALHHQAGAAPRTNGKRETFSKDPPCIYLRHDQTISGGSGQVAQVDAARSSTISSASVVS